MTLAAQQDAQDALAPGRVLRVYGMRRSGNHAIIDWMLRNAPDGNGLFLNACRPGRDPVNSARSIGVYKAGEELASGGLQSKLRDVGLSVLTIVSYEDATPSRHDTQLFDAPETRVIILRSFLNWSASLLRKVQNNPKYGPVERVRIMMTSIGKYKSMLDHAQRPDATAIVYDTWMAQDSYRRDRLEQLDLPGRDLSRGAVQRFGGGSSFQGRVEDVSKLSTDQRSAEMADDDEYKLVMSIATRDDDLIERLTTWFPEDSPALEAHANRVSIT